MAIMKRAFTGEEIYKRTHSWPSRRGPSLGRRSTREHTVGHHEESLRWGGDLEESTQLAIMKRAFAGEEIYKRAH